MKTNNLLIILSTLFLLFMPENESNAQNSGLPDNNKSQMVIASCQFPVSGNISQNAEWIHRQMREAKSKGAEIVHFPECALSGYGGSDIKDYSNFDWEKLRIETKSILDLAKELKIWIILGSSHRLSEGKLPHNSLYLINPDGEIVDRYDKRFCTTGDLKYYSPGDHFVVFEINEINCGLLICYDLRFPELFREYRKMDVDVLFHSFYNARMSKDNILPVIMPATAQARAATNYFFMSLTNSSSQQSWPCQIITPDGMIKKKLKANKPGILITEIDITKKYYDSGRPFRTDAMNGKLNSGELVKDSLSTNRTGY